MTDTIPPQAWSRRLDKILMDYGRPARLVSLSTILKMLPVVARIINNNRKKTSVGFDPISAMKAEPPGRTRGCLWVESAGDPLVEGGEGISGVGRCDRDSFMRR